jgi:ubiquinone/menaquinone biosynthesis C-methylase UbiE
MTTINDQFVGTIPDFYDTGLGPNIFHDYADDLAARAGAHGARHVLELAAGTGILSRRLRDVLSPDARLVVTDLNQPMLDLASRKFSSAENVEFSEADAMNLSFSDDEFDMIVCQFGVMFFPDKPASYREAARVLKPNGHYIFNTWGPMSANPYSQISHEVVAQFFPGNPPGFYEAPFSYGDPVDVKRDLNAAGWQDVHHETIDFDKEILDPEAFANAMIHGTPMVDEIRQRGGVDPQDVVDLILEQYYDRFGTGPAIMPLQATSFVCRAP